MSSQEQKNTANVVPLYIASATNAVRHVFVRNLMLKAHIGAYEHEKDATQDVRFNIDLSVHEGSNSHDDDLSNVVCYDKVVQNIKAILAAGHINLVETLAEMIASDALTNPMVIAARVRVEKLSAISEAESVGVEIERHKTLEKK